MRRLASIWVVLGGLCVVASKREDRGVRLQIRLLALHTGSRNGTAPALERKRLVVKGEEQEYVSWA